MKRTTYNGASFFTIDMREEKANSHWRRSHTRRMFALSYQALGRVGRALLWLIRAVMAVLGFAGMLAVLLSYRRERNAKDLTSVLAVTTTVTLFAHAVHA